MANLSQGDRTVIAEYPLDNCLGHLQDSLRKAEQIYRPDSLSYSDTVDSSDQEPRKAISKLLYTLEGHDVALDLRSDTGNRNVALDLIEVRGRIHKGDFNYEHYRALSRLVIRKTSDFDIWNAVLNLINSLSWITPPTRHSSASQQGGEQTKKLVERMIFEEIKNCTYRNVRGFFSKYFEGKDWTERTKEIYRAVQDQYADGRWTDFPEPPVQDAVLEWLFRFQEEFLFDARGVYYTSESSKDLTGAEARPQLDIFIKQKSNASGTIHNWKDVQVIGEHQKSNSKDFKPLLLQLGRYMRNVFTAQPTRRFIHGFFLSGTTMELWVFDRSGPYSSGEFDIHRNRSSSFESLQGTP